VGQCLAVLHEANVRLQAGHMGHERSADAAVIRVQHVSELLPI
jgi:hypothetical protein